MCNEHWYPNSLFSPGYDALLSHYRVILAVLFRKPSIHERRQLSTALHGLRDIILAGLSSENPSSRLSRHVWAYTLHVTQL